MRIKLMEGLGDCLVAGAGIQALAKYNNTKIDYITSPILKPVFNYHPYINFATGDGEDIQLKWVSQLKKPEFYHVHTINRFALQLGMSLDPTTTMDIYNSDGKICNTPDKSTVCINVFSKEKSRRYIPSNILDEILAICYSKNLEVIWLGDCGSYKSITDISQSIDALSHTKLFIGPVSFQYHLASCLNVKSMCFFSYMPYWKFSDFKNTTPIYGNLPCINFCEEFESINRTQMQCHGGCKVSYDYRLVRSILEGLC